MEPTGGETSVKTNQGNGQAGSPAPAMTPEQGKGRP
jgi:hypothetical protein